MRVPNAARQYAEARRHAVEQVVERGADEDEGDDPGREAERLARHDHEAAGQRRERRPAVEGRRRESSGVLLRP
jgi:hypothetical protein